MDMAKRTVLLPILLSLLLSSSCTVISPANRGPHDAEAFYQQGREQLQEKNMLMAVTTLDEMERRFPLHVRTHQLYLELADAYHAQGEDEKAQEMAMRFVRRFPNHRDVDYAYYIIGVADFSRAIVALAPDNQQPDPSFAYAATKRFLHLIRHYPQSLYQVHARDHIAYLRALLGQYELQRVEHQLEEKRFTEAIERANTLITLYPETDAAKAASALLAGIVVPHTKPVAEKEPPDVSATESITSAPVVVEVVAEKAVENVEPSAIAEDEAWIMSRNPRSYTIQVAGNSRLETLKAEMVVLGVVDKVVYFKRIRKGRDWYSAIYGDYSTRREGLAATDALKAELGRESLWLRRFGKIQKSMISP